MNKMAHSVRPTGDIKTGSASMVGWQGCHNRVFSSAGRQSVFLTCDIALLNLQPANTCRGIC